jgi:hypothetical protein
MENQTPDGRGSTDESGDEHTPPKDIQLELDLADPTPLPTHVSGLQTLYGEVLQCLLASEYGLIARAPSDKQLVEYAEYRMPYVFHPDSAARDIALSALGYTRHVAETVVPPAGGMTWPVNPIFLAGIVTDITTTLIDHLEADNVYLPGMAEYREWRELQRIPMVMDNASSTEPYRARTGFLDDPDGDRKVQYCIRRQHDDLLLSKRLCGSTEFVEIGELPHESVVGVIALLQRYRRVTHIAA